MRLLGIQLIGFWPVWRWYFGRMTDGSDEPWGVVALGSAALLLFFRKDWRITAGTVAVSTLIALLYLASCFAAPPLLRAVIAVSALASLTAGSSTWGSSLYGLLLLSLPIVSSLEFFLGYPLRLVLTRLVASFLHYAGGLNVTADGTLLNWDGTIVAVDAPCSGIHMLWAGLFVTFLLAAILRLNSKKTFSAILFAGKAILIANLLRAIVLFYKETKIVPLPEWTHAAIGLLFFALASLAITLKARRLAYAAA